MRDLMVRYRFAIRPRISPLGFGFTALPEKALSFAATSASQVTSCAAASAYFLRSKNVRLVSRHAVRLLRKADWMLARAMVLPNVPYFVTANLMRASARFLPGRAFSFNTRPTPHSDKPRVRPLELPQELVISSMVSPSTTVPSPTVGAHASTVLGHGLLAPLNTPSVNASLTMSAPLAESKLFVVLLMSANPDPLAPEPPHMVSGMTVAPKPAHTCPMGRLWPVHEPYCATRGSFCTTHTSSIT